MADLVVKEYDQAPHHLEHANTSAKKEVVSLVFQSYLVSIWIPFKPPEKAFKGSKQLLIWYDWRILED